MPLNPAEKRQVYVYALTAPFATHVPVSAKNIPQLVLESTEATRAATQSIRRLTDEGAASAGRPFFTEGDLSEAHMQRMYDNLVAAPPAAAATTGDRIDRPSTAAQLARLPRPSTVVDGGAASTSLQVVDEAPLQVKVPPAAQRPERRRVRRGGSGMASTGVAAGRGGTYQPTERSMATIVRESPGTLGLSQRIAIAALEGVVSRENSGSLEYRQDALATIKAAVDATDTDYGHVRHLPNLLERDSEEEREDWKECAYEVTLVWDARDDGASYTVSMLVSHPVKEPRMGAQVRNQTWTPCVALVENRGEMLGQILSKFALTPPSGDVDVLVTRLAKLLSTKVFGDGGSKSVSVEASDKFELGTSGALPNRATVEETVRSFDRFVPAPTRVTVVDTETVTFTLHTCPLLAATLWPIVYADAEMVPHPLALRCAIEDYGDQTIAHSLTMSNANVVMPDAKFDDKAVWQEVNALAKSLTKLVTLCNSGAGWLVECGDLLVDAPAYMQALGETLEKATSKMAPVTRMLKEPTLDDDGQTLVYHAAAWGLLTPLLSLQNVMDDMLDLVRVDAYGRGIREVEFAALKAQLSLDVTRFNTIYLGAPIWTPQRDELSDLYEAAINARHEVERTEKEVREFGEDEADETNDVDRSAFPNCKFMAERAASLGFRYRAADQFEERMTRFVSTVSRTAAAHLASLATGLGTRSLKTPEQLAEVVLDAVAKMGGAMEMTSRMRSVPWDLTVIGCLKEVESARDVVCTAWLQSNQRTVAPVGASSISTAEMIANMEVACSVLHSTMLDLHRSSAHASRTMTLSDDKRFFRARHANNMLKVARAKLVIAATRLAPRKAETLTAHATVKSLISEHSLAAQTPNARAILDLFKHKRQQGSVAASEEIGRFVPAETFDAAFRVVDRSHRLNLIVDAAILVAASVHHHLEDDPTRAFNWALVEESLLSAETRAMLRMCPLDQGLVECVVHALNNLGDIRDVGGERLSFDHTFDRETIAHVMCEVCEVSETLCRKWIEDVHEYDCHDIATRVASGLQGFARERGVRMLTAATPQRKTSVRKACFVAAAVLAGAGPPGAGAAYMGWRMYAEQQRCEAVESAPPSSTPEFATIELPETPPVPVEPSASPSFAPAAQPGAGRYLGFYLGKQHAKRWAEAEDGYAATYRIRTVGYQTHEDDPSPAEATETLPQYEDIVRSTAATEVIETSAPGPYATGRPMDADTTAKVASMAWSNPVGAALLMEEASGGPPPLVAVVEEGLAAAATLRAEGDYDDDGVPGLARFVSGAMRTNECTLVEIGGFNTTELDDGRRGITRLVPGATDSSTEFVVTVAKDALGEQTMSKDAMFHAAADSCLASLNGEETVSVPGWNFKEFADQASAYGFVPVARGVPRALNKDMRGVVCLERERFQQAFGAHEYDGEFHVTREASQLVGGLMMSASEVAAATPYNADGSRVPVVEVASRFAAELDARTASFKAAAASGQAPDSIKMPGWPSGMGFASADAPVEGKTAWTWEVLQRLEPLNLASAYICTSGIVSAPIGAPPPAGTGDARSKLVTYLRGDAKFGKDLTDIKPPPMDMEASIVAPEGSTDHVSASRALRAAIGKTLSRYPSAKQELIARACDRSSMAHVAYNVPGFDSLEYARQHYRFCPHAEDDAIRSLAQSMRPRLTTESKDGWLWEAAIAKMGVPFVLESDESFGSDEEDGPELRPTIEDVDVSDAEDGRPPAAAADNDDADDGGKDNGGGVRPGLPGRRVTFNDRVEKFGVQALGSVPSMGWMPEGHDAAAPHETPAATGAFDPITGKLETEDPNDVAGRAIRSALLNMMKVQGAVTLGVSVASWLSPYGAFLSGPLIKAYVAENVRQVVVLGIAAHSGFVRVNQLRGDDGTTRGRLDTEADQAFNHGINVGLTTRERENQGNVVVQEYLKQVAWTTSAVFFLGYSTYRRSVYDLNGGGESYKGVLEEGLVANVLLYGLMSDMFSGIDGIFDQRKTPRRCNEYLAGLVMDVGLTTFALAAGARQLATLVYPTTFPNADVDIAPYMGDFQYALQWLRYGSHFLGIGIMARRMSGLGFNSIMRWVANTGGSSSANQFSNVLRQFGNVQTLSVSAMSAALCASYFRIGGDLVGLQVKQEDALEREVASLINVNSVMVMHLLDCAVVVATTRMLNREVRRWAVGAEIPQNNAYHVDSTVLSGAVAVLSSAFLVSGAAGAFASSSGLGTLFSSVTLQLMHHGVPRRLLDNWPGFLRSSAGSYLQRLSFEGTMMQQALLSVGVIGATVVAQVAVDRAILNTHFARRHRYAAGCARAASGLVAIGALAVENTGLGRSDEPSPDRQWLMRVGGTAATVVLTMQAVQVMQIGTIVGRVFDPNGNSDAAALAAMRPYMQQAGAAVNAAENAIIAATAMIGMTPRQGRQAIGATLGATLGLMALVQFWNDMSEWGRVRQGGSLATPDDWMDLMGSQGTLPGTKEGDKKVPLGFLGDLLTITLGTIDEKIARGVSTFDEMIRSTGRINLRSEDNPLVVALRGEGKPKTKVLAPPAYPLETELAQGALESLNRRLRAHDTPEKLEQFAAEVYAVLVRERSFGVHITEVDETEMSAMMALSDGVSRTSTAALRSFAMEVTRTPGVLHTVWPAMQAMHVRQQPPDAVPKELLPPPPAQLTKAGEAVGEEPTELGAPLGDVPLDQGDWFDAWLGYEPTVASGASVPVPSIDDDAHVRVGGIGGSDAGLQLLRREPDPHLRPLGDLFQSLKKQPRLREVRLNGAPSGAKPAASQQEGMRWGPGDKVGDVDPSLADGLRTPLARLGLGIVSVEGATRLDIVNLLKTNLDLCGAKGTTPASVVGSLDVKVWRYALAGKYAQPSEVVSMCQAFVAECTHRLVMCSALRHAGGVASADAIALDIPTEIGNALAAVKEAGAGIKFASGASGTLAVSQILGKTVGQFLKQAGVAGVPAEPATSAVNDVRDYIGTLMSRLAVTAYDQFGTYRLLYPMQIARIDAEIVLDAKLPDTARVQIPATQAAEYGAVAAVRETHGMQAGVAARGNWSAISSVADALSNNNQHGQHSGVRVIGDDPVQRLDNVLYGLVPPGTGPDPNQWRGFSFLASGNATSHDAAAQSIWVYETEPDREERATLVYMALRIAAAAAATPARGEPVVRHLTLLRYTGDEVDPLDGSLRARFGVTGEMHEQPVYRWDTAAFKVDQVARDLVRRLETSTTGADRLAIHISLGPMRLPPVENVVEKSTGPEVDRAFPTSVQSSLVVSHKRMRASLMKNLPRPEAGGGSTDVHVGQALDMLSAASAVRGGAFSPVLNLDARDVTRVTDTNPSVANVKTYARYASHSTADAQGVGYADHGRGNEFNLTCSYATPYVRETWGSLGVHSPASCQRASEALQVAAVAAALRRQQIEPGKFDELRTKPATALPLDDDDLLLRAMLTKGQTETSGLEGTQLQAMLAVSTEGRFADAARATKDLSNGFLSLSKASLDLMGRMALVLDLATSSGEQAYFKSAAVMAAAIISSPEGNKGMQSIEAVYKVLAIGFNGRLARWICSTLFGASAKELVAQVRGRPARVNRGPTATVLSTGGTVAAAIVSVGGTSAARAFMLSGPALHMATKHVKTGAHFVNGFLPGLLIKNPGFGWVIRYAPVNRMVEDMLQGDADRTTVGVALRAAVVAFLVEVTHVAISKITEKLGLRERFFEFDFNDQNLRIALEDPFSTEEPPAGAKTNKAKANDLARNRTSSDPTADALCPYGHSDGYQAQFANYLTSNGWPIAGAAVGVGACTLPEEIVDAENQTSAKKPQGPEGAQAGDAPKQNSVESEQAKTGVTTAAALAHFERAAMSVHGVPRLKMDSETDRLAAVTRWLANTVFGIKGIDKTMFETRGTQNMALETKIKERIIELQNIAGANGEDTSRQIPRPMGVDLEIDRRPAESSSSFVERPRLYELYGNAYADAHATRIASNLASGNPSHQIQGLVGLQWAGAAYISQLGDANQRRLLGENVARYYPTSTSTHAMLTGEGVSYRNGTASIVPGQLENEARSEVGVDPEAGWDYDWKTQTVKATMATFGTHFARTMFSGLQARAAGRNIGPTASQQLLRKVQEKGTFDTLVADVALADAPPNVAAMGIAAAAGQKTPDKQAAAKRWMKSWGHLNPGSYSWLAGGAGLALATYHLTKEARLAYALNESVDRFRGRLVSRVAQTSLASITLAVAGVAVQGLIILATQKYLPVLITGLATFFATGATEGLLGSLQEHLTAFGLTVFSIWTADLGSQFYLRFLAPNLAWFGSWNARRMVMNSESGKGFFPVVRSLSTNTELGWLTRLVTTAKDTSHARSVAATQYATELAAIVGVGALRLSASEGIDFGYETPLMGVKNMLWEAAKANGAMLLKLEKKQETRVKDLITTIMAVNQSGGAAARLKDDAASNRFKALSSTDAPRAVSAYAALFGNSLANAIGMERPHVPAGHAMVAPAGGVVQPSTVERPTVSVQVTDALRGAVAGCYDGLVRSTAERGIEKQHWHSWRIVERSPQDMYHRMKLAPQSKHLASSNQLAMDVVRMHIVHQVAAGFSTPTLAEFAILCADALTMVVDPPGRVAIDATRERALAVDAVLAPLEEAVDRFSQAAGFGVAMETMPTCGLRVRRRGLIEQGRLWIVWTEDVATMPTRPTGFGDTQWLDACNQGLTERFLRAKGVMRKQEQQPAYVANQLIYLYGGFGGNDVAMNVLRPICVPLVDSSGLHYGCRSFDDVLLGDSATEIGSLRRQLEEGVRLTQLLRARLRPGNDAAGLLTALNEIFEKGYAPTILSPYNALLPASVLGRSADVFNDVDGLEDVLGMP